MGKIDKCSMTYQKRGHSLVVAAHCMLEERSITFVNRLYFDHYVWTCGQLGSYRITAYRSRSVQSGRTKIQW